MLFTFYIELFLQGERVRNRTRVLFLSSYSWSRYVETEPTSTWSKRNQIQKAGFSSVRRAVWALLVGLAGCGALLKENATYRLRKIIVEWIMAAQGALYLFLQLAEKSCCRIHFKHQFCCQGKVTMYLSHAWLQPLCCSWEPVKLSIKKFSFSHPANSYSAAHLAVLQSTFPVRVLDFIHIPQQDTRQGSWTANGSQHLNGTNSAVGPDNAILFIPTRS